MKSKEHFYKRLGRFILFISIGIILSTQHCLAQRKNDLLKSSSMFLEVETRWGLYSINYDRIFYHSRPHAFSWRSGFGVMSTIHRDIGFNISLLTELVYLYGRRRSFLEISSSVRYWQAFKVDTDVNWSLQPRIGYRYQVPEGGLFFRIGFIPDFYLHRHLDGFYDLWKAGISIGYTFKRRSAGECD